MTFGHQVRVMRAIRGLTQADLADVVGCDRGILVHIEKSHLLPTDAMQDEIKAALRWPADADQAFAMLADERAEWAHHAVTGE